MGRTQGAKGIEQPASIFSFLVVQRETFPLEPSHFSWETYAILHDAEI
jgi:hypothetical protein